MKLNLNQQLLTQTHSNNSSKKFFVNKDTLLKKRDLYIL